MASMYQLTLDTVKKNIPKDPFHLTTSTPKAKY